MIVGPNILHHSILHTLPLVYILYPVLIVTCSSDESDSKSWEDFLSVVTVLVTEKRYRQYALMYITVLCIVFV